MNLDSLELYRGIFERHPWPQLLVEIPSGRILHANRAAAVFYGRAEAELRAATLYELMADPTADVEAIVGALLDGSRSRASTRQRLAGGHWSEVAIDAAVVAPEGGHPVLHITKRDVSEQTRIDNALRDYRELFEDVPVPFYRATPGPRGRFLRVNPAFLRLFEAESAEQLFGLEIASLYVDPADRERFSRALLENGQVFRYELRMRTVTGREIWTADTAYRHLDENGEPVFDGVLEDITRRHELEEELSFQARHDQLTGLANRRNCEDMLELEIGRAERYGDPLAALMIDIDHFKRINDRHGHAAGDRVLQGVAEMVRRRVRQADLPARWGGEEFVVLLPATSSAHGRRLGEALRHAVADRGAGDDPGVTVSIGCAGYRRGEGVESFLHRLDNALYAAKHAGRNRVVEAEETDDGPPADA